MNSFVSKLLRNKSTRSICHLFFYLSTLPLFFLGYCIPKKSSLWVFANTFGFKDNARYLFEYVRQHHPEITPIWIITWGDNATAPSFGIKRLSLKGLWYQYRAGVVFVSTGKGDLARFTLAGTKIIQLWHGIPIKRILLDSPESIPFSAGPAILRSFSLHLLKNSLKSYDMVIASSEFVQQRLMSAFGLPEKQVVITGYPRHDILLENSSPIRKRILYAPTWRSNIEEAFTIVSGVCNKEFITKIEDLGYELWLSIHPLNLEIMGMLAPSLLSSIQTVDDEDINLILAQTEILITDYSSVALDFAMLQRKTIFYTPDADEYFASRGVYSEFESLITTQGVDSTADIVSRFSDQSSALPSLYREMLFQYHDSDARKRIVQLIKKNIC